MPESSPDELRRIYVQIAAMRKNLNQLSFDHDADRFHQQLDRLDRAGYDVAEFRLDPDKDMYHRETSYSPSSGSTYERRKTIQPGVLESKMDAVLMYLEGKQ